MSALVPLFLIKSALSVGSSAYHMVWCKLTSQAINVLDIGMYAVRKVLVSVTVGVYILIISKVAYGMSITIDIIHCLR